MRNSSSLTWTKKTKGLRRPCCLVLRAAHEEGLTLVTYDERTIPPILVEWGIQGIPHSGVLFVGEDTVASSDIDGIIRSLAGLWKEQNNLN
jgi:hypothetical protein